MTVVYQCGPGKTYTVLNAAFGALPPGTFTDTQEIQVFWQSGGYDTNGGIVLTGFAPTASFPLIVRGMQPFTGAPGSQSLAYDSTNSGTFRVNTSIQYMQWLNLEIDGGTSQGFLFLGSNIFTLNDCYLHNNSSSVALLASGGSCTYSLINSIIYGAGVARPYDSRIDTAATVDYCFFGTGASDYAVISGTESNFTNTYGFGGSTQTFYTGGGATGSYNASSDTTATTLFTNSIANTSAASVITNVASDWTLKAGGNTLVDAGVVTSVTVDIIGTSRPQGSAPDIGPWERIVSSGGRANRLTLLGVC